MDKQFDALSISQAEGVSRREVARKFCIGLSALAVLAALTVSAALAQTYTVTDLGTLGGPTSYAQAINNNGQVVGTADTKQAVTGTGHGQKQKFYIYNAFLWSPTTPGGATGSIKGLKTPKGDYSEGGGINAGSYAVGADLTTGNAMLWQPDGTVVGLPGLESGNTAGNYPASINDLGQAAGFCNTSQNPRAVIWQSGQVFSLGVLMNGDSGSAATAINSQGQVVGYSDDGAGQGRPFLWTPASPNGTTGAMLALDPSGGFGVALGLNNPGPGRSVQVVGFSWVANNNANAFVWDSAHGMQIIGPGLAYGINSAGQVVGRTTGARAFLWQNGVTIDLNSLIPSNSGWLLQSAGAINERGQIVGSGVSPSGNVHAFLLTP